MPANMPLTVCGAPDEIVEALRSQILAACKPWIEVAGSQVTTISAAFADGLEAVIGQQRAAHPD